MTINRRQFHILAGGAGLAALIPSAAEAATNTRARWYERVKRWGQINLTADDATQFDLAFWRDYWKATRSQGVIVSAGGQIAFYPTDLADQPRVPGLGTRDLFGELAKAARDEGLEVMARMSLRGSPELVAKYPDWANVDAEGQRLTTPCMNGGYFYKYGADIVREVGTRYRPSGFTLSGWGQNYSLCYCETCRSLFQKSTGQPLPKKKDFDDPLYRRWMEWNDDQVIALWDYNNRVAREAGGRDCVWVGQLLGSFLTRNLRRISQRAPLMMIDHQAAEDESGVVDNSVFGKVLGGLRDWTAPATVATALYAPRMNSPRPEEIDMWMTEGMAGGARPWWNVIGGYSEDKRRFSILPSLLQWHEKNEAYLFDRWPAANVGLVWSDTNNVYFGRDDFAARVRLPWQGTVNALTRAAIPFVPIHADDIDRDAASLDCLVFPNLAAMTETQLGAVRRFVQRGGGVLATGQTSLFDRYGSPLPNYALADLFGAALKGDRPPADETGPSAEQLLKGQSRQMQIAGAYVPTDLAESSRSLQSFLRLTPELRAGAFGPKREGEPAIAAGASRHPVLKGLEGTDIIYFGGRLVPLLVADDAQVLMTFVPPIVDTQPENAVFKQTHTDFPGLIVREAANGRGRVAFLPAALDRLYEQRNLPDHGDLLANLVRWVVRDNLPLEVDARGLFDFNLYRQPGRLILHIANLNNAAAWRKPFEGYSTSGPLELRLKLPQGVAGASARLLVAGNTLPSQIAQGWASFRVPSVAGHEVVVVS